ncbi:hypothetical protein DESC_80005 [Desulfosarcina cetonica]|nr:hypothetical protein DESC_80005 [Desulfosarcina cetonica]
MKGVWGRESGDGHEIMRLDFPNNYDDKETSMPT